MFVRDLLAVCIALNLLPRSNSLWQRQDTSFRVAKGSKRISYRSTDLENCNSGGSTRRHLSKRKFESLWVRWELDSYVDNIKTVAGEEKFDEGDSWEFITVNTTGCQLLTPTCQQFLIICDPQILASESAPTNLTLHPRIQRQQFSLNVMNKTRVQGHL